MTKPAPKPVDPNKPKKPGPTAGMTKEERPRLSNRLPREKGGLIAALGDGLTPFDRAKQILGVRVQETKLCYLLDGKPCNATAILAAAGIIV